MIKNAWKQPVDGAREAAGGWKTQHGTSSSRVVTLNI